MPSSGEAGQVSCSSLSAGAARLYVLSVSSDKRSLKRRDPPPSAVNSADPVRNFTITLDQRIRALTIGVPPWAARKRKIEDDAERFVDELVDLHDTLAAKGCSAEEIDAALVEKACAFDLGRINALVRDHNRYYPIEANLPMDRKTGWYLAYGRPWVPEEPYTAERLVALARAELTRRESDE